MPSLNNILKKLEKENSATKRHHFDSLEFKNSDGNKTTIKSGNPSSDITFTLPNDYGESGYVLKTNDSGILSWVAQSGGSLDVSGLDFKESCRVATTTNIPSLSGEQTIDGISIVAGDRVLVKDQTNGSENGIYSCSNSAWDRTTDFDSDSDVSSGAFTFIEEGTENSDSGFVLTTDGDITLGGTSLTFAQFSGAGQITAGDGLTKSGNTLNVSVDDSSIEINSDSLRVKGSGITNDMLAGSIGNNKLSNSTISGVSLGSNLYNLTVDNSSLQLNSDTTFNGSAAKTISVKNSGITNDMLAGSIDLTSKVSEILPIASGGTGAETAVGARTALGVDPAGTDNSTDVTLASVSENYLSMSGQEITAGTVPVSLGGTGATTASEARTALGVDAAGTNNYSLPNASSSTLGGIKVGTNLSIDGDGVLSSTDTTYSVGDGGLTENNFTDALKSKLDGIEASANNYSLLTASSSTLGGIKVGTNLSIDGDGVLSSTDTTYSVGDGGLTENNFTDALKSKLDGIEASANNYSLLTASSSTLGGIKVGTNLSIDGDGVLSSTDTTYSVGDEGLTENNFTDALKSKLDGIEASANNYSLLTASSSTLGGIKVGTNLSIDGDGVLSSTDTNTTYAVGDGGLTENNFTDALKSKLDGIEASANNYSLSTASPSTLGGIKVGTNLSIDGDGVLSSTDTTYSVGDEGLTENNFTDALKSKLDGIEASANNYSLPTASSSTLGGIKVGTNLSIDGDGVLSSTDTNTTYTVGDGGLTQNNFTDALKSKLDGIDDNANNYSLPTASSSTLGGIKVGTNLSIDGNGVLSSTDTTYTVGDGGLTQNNFTDTLKTKLDGIDDSADVTDATNVAAAGAVMNTGDETIAGTKTFSSTIDGSINGNAATVTILDNNDNTDFPIVFHNESTGKLIDDTGSVAYNPNKGELKFPDDKKIIFGDGHDLKIYHDGSHSHIEDAGDGDLVITATHLKMRAHSHAHDFIRATANGSIQLLHQGVKELETTSNGINITGHLKADKVGDYSSSSNYMYFSFVDNTYVALFHNSMGDNEEFRFTNSGGFHAGDDITAFSTTLGSDRRLKTNIKKIKYGLKDILKLNSVEFDWKEKRNKKHDIGFIAQEVKEVIPEIIAEIPNFEDENNNYLGVDYSKVVPVLVESVKEQQEEINSLKQMNNELLKRLEILETKIN